MHEAACSEQDVTWKEVKEEMEERWGSRVVWRKPMLQAAVLT